ncbi:MAG: SPFH domain-containing protein [Phycisphaerales bacterium]|nr:MAG: SPFH domain-containing protein [Phycisphaerales bacterium]
MTQERTVMTWNGWPMLGALTLALAGWIALVAWSATRAPVWGTGLAIGIAAALVWCFLMAGFFTLQPNMSAVLILFGAYKGTSRESGFRWANPLLSKHKVSLRAHNLNGKQLKVNDRRGNPVEIAVVVVWRVQNTAQAVFDVEDYKEYVEVQSESAVRHLASRYPYDTGEEEELSLRGSTDEVSKDLQIELAERLVRAGVTVDEARLTHLAFAPEIAGAMLRRQQAEAIVAARKRIVEGAVGMVELALTQLDAHGTIKLDDERRASMVSNLLVVLCGEREASPVINTGSLYG